MSEYDEHSVLDKQAIEVLRQEQETFNQHKSHEHRWFFLRLVMGYTSVALLLSIFVICVYIFFNHRLFPTEIVTAASVAFFVDVVGLVAAVWKIVFNSDFMTKLAPVTQDMPIIATPENTPNESKEDRVEVKEITTFSAKYGKGEKANDVTEIVQAIVTAATEGHMRFTINNDLFAVGGDPVEGDTKELKIVYSYAGETRTITARERKELSLP